MFTSKDKFAPFKAKVWLSSPTMHGDEMRYITEAYETNWMSTVGANINEVERVAAEKAGVKYAVALSSCTAALHLCAKLAGEKLYGKPNIGHGALEGKRVFCSDMTFAATLNPVVYEGAIPVFIDTEYESWNMNGFQIKRLITLLKSGIWNTISQLGKLLSEGLDLLITNVFISDSSMGIVSISKTLSTYIQLLNSTIASTMIPKLTYHYSRNETQQYHRQLFSDMQLLSFTSSLMLSVLVIFADYFSTLWVPSQDAEQLMILTVLGSFWMVVSGVMSSIFNAFTVQNKLRFNSIAMIISGIVSTIILIIALKLTNWGIYAVACISSVVYIIKNLFFVVPYAEKVVGIKAWDVYKLILRSVLSTGVTIIVFRGILGYFELGSWLKLIVAGVWVTATITVVFAFVYFPFAQIKAGLHSIKTRLKR